MQITNVQQKGPPLQEIPVTTLREEGSRLPFPSLVSPGDVLASSSSVTILCQCAVLYG